VQAARKALRDKGLYRWPPHMNLLYPFVAPAHFGAAAALLASSLEALATPPVITLDALACFGGRSRGVLYACCSSTEDTEALQRMQEALQASMPYCDDQQRKNEGGKRGSFTPHMTLSHFSSREEAEAAKALLAPTWQPLTFSCAQAIHLMYREGGGGQFERACTLSFGGEAMSTFFSPPRRWESMPAVEEEWVCDARKNAYRRGIGGGRGGQRSRRPRRSREEREAIQARTPEEIAEIRAQRAAKRARLEAGEL
jgi:2'-5' RNA ligase